MRPIHSTKNNNPATANSMLQNRKLRNSKPCYSCSPIRPLAIRKEDLTCSVMLYLHPFIWSNFLENLGWYNATSKGKGKLISTQLRCLLVVVGGSSCWRASRRFSPEPGMDDMKRRLPIHLHPGPPVGNHTCTYPRVYACMQATWISYVFKFII